MLVGAGNGGGARFVRGGEIRGCKRLVAALDGDGGKPARSAAEQSARQGVRLARSIWDNTLRIAKELNVEPPPVRTDV
jgi:hypothetical protein